MKLILLLLSSAAFLLSALAANASTNAVLDTDGNKLRRGVEYYIIQSFLDLVGGFTQASRNRTCPLNVVEANSSAYPGLPLTFSPVDPKKTPTIRLSTDLNIVFSAPVSCFHYSTVWKVARVDESTGRNYYVTTGGVSGNPGPETLNNWFRIERDPGGDYKLVFCPQVCDTCRPHCGDLGVIRNGLLGLTDDELPVRFMRKKV